jgi:hypothetical protein
MAEDRMKNVPLRSWASESYSPTTGRAAKSTEGPQARQSADSETWTNSSQRDAGRSSGQNGAPGFGWCDKNRTQGGT